MELISKDKLNIAADCLRNGGLVAFPTETVYGLGANALNPIAVAGIFEAKKRPSFDPLIVHIADAEKVYELFASPIDPLVFQLIEKFWPGPLTIVHKKSGIVPDIVTSGLNEVAVRMPSHPVALDLIRLAGIPVAAPSANLFGQLSPTTHKHVAKQKMNIDYIVTSDEKTDNVGIESTVVSVENGQCTILRPGVIIAKDIEEAIEGITVHIPGKNIKISSPGLLKSHYSPTKPLYFLTDNIKIEEGSGVIFHSKTADQPYPVCIYTSLTGNLLEIASNLFSALHEMEENPLVKTIYIQKVEEKGIGVAIMDRLNKATHQYL
jgi:L-threonylcarbamoyladenylate synthase